MEYGNMLKINYHYALRFSHLENIYYVPDVTLFLDNEQAIKLLEEIRKCLRNGSDTKLIKVGNYDINIITEHGKDLTLSIVESNKEKSKPLGTFTYNTYMCDKSIMSGITNIIAEIRYDM